MKTTFAWLGRSQLTYAVLHALCLAAAIALLLLPIEYFTALTPTKLSLSHALIFIVGPVFILSDLILPMQKTRRRHHLNTALRVGIIALAYATTLTSISSPSTALNMLGYLLNFVAMYFVGFFSLYDLAIKPTHWLRYDNRLHTIFLAAMVAAIVLELGLVAPIKSLGMWALAAMTISVLLAWRYALWYNAGDNMSPAQHADVWPMLAKYREPQQFWNQLELYLFKNATLIPIAPLTTLTLPTLLGYFELEKPEPLIGTFTYQRILDECVKAAINTKEPRAAFIWQLYSAKEAAGYIKRIDEFVVNGQMESIELPTL